VSQPSRAAHMRRSTPAMFDYTIDPLGCPATDCQPHVTPSTALLRLARPTTSVCDAAQNAGLRPEAIQYKNEMPNPAAGGRAVVAAGADAERAGKMRWTEISPPLHCHAPGCRGSQPYPAPAIAGPARVWTGDIVDAVAARLTTCLCVSRVSPDWGAGTLPHMRLLASSMGASYLRRPGAARLIADRGR
jgi:hypothetical protein